jgi:hypothetical protein
MVNSKRTKESTDISAIATSDGTSDETSDGTSDETSDGTSDEISDGTSDETSDGISEGTSNGNSDVSTDEDQIQAHRISGTRQTTPCGRQILGRGRTLDSVSTDALDCSQPAANKA